MKPRAGSTTEAGQYILFVDTSNGGIVADRAKLFKTGGSQAVRLPKGYRFEGQSEVLIYRNGHRVVLEPIQRHWSEAFIALAGSAEDFPYPAEPPEAEPAADFDS